MVVNQVLLFQYLHRSEDELGEGLARERQQASTLSQASHKECASSTITPNASMLTGGGAMVASRMLWFTLRWLPLS